MSRTRLIRPAFFSDELMARVSLASRLIYIGLWTLADDAGYFERKPAEIAVALFPWDRPARRSRLVEKALEELAGLERIQWFECGLHGLIPTLPEHVTKAGNHAYTHKARHQDICELTLFRSRGRRGGIEVTDESVRGHDKSPSVLVLGSGSVLGSESGRPAGRAVDNPLREAALASGGFARALATKP